MFPRGRSDYGSERFLFEAGRFLPVRNLSAESMTRFRPPGLALNLTQPSPKWERAYCTSRLFAYDLLQLGARELLLAGLADLDGVVADAHDQFVSDRGVCAQLWRCLQ